MSKLSLVADTLKIIGVSADVLNNKNVQGVAKLGLNVRDLRNVGGAITQLSGQTTIISRIFAEEAAVNEVVYPLLVKHFHEWYSAQILSALSLSKLITSKVSIKDVFSVIQDGRQSPFSDLGDNILKEVAGVESFLGNYKGEAAVEALGTYSLGKRSDKPDSVADQNVDVRKLEAENKALKQPFKDASVSMKSTKASEHKLGPMGELFEVTITNPTNKELSAKVPIYIQMQPTIVPSFVAPRFIDLNVVPNLWQRWTQWRAGEIGFWKDFMFKKDLMDRKMAVVKDPESAHAMTQFLSTITKKDRYAIADVGYGRKNPHSANLANSVVVFTEDSVAQAKADSGVDLHDEETRINYFKNTYTLIIAIVDTMHQRVTVYFNGIDGALNNSYNDFKQPPKSDSADFMNALAAFSTNSIGRLR